MRTSIRLIGPLVALTVLPGSAFGQAMPTTQPGLLTIYIEEVKLGRHAEHTANEAGWPAAFAKANSPDFYLALAALTGTSEVWFVVPYESFAREGEAMKLSDSDPALAAELARLSRTDAEYLNSARTIQAIARPDLSYGAFPDLAKARFWDITVMRVRPGQDAAFEAAAKTYGEASKRLAPNASYRVYQVSAGMPGGTYLIFSSVNAYAEFDQMMASGQAVWTGMTARERAVFDKFGAEGLMNAVTNRYRLDPAMSYVDAATKAADPAFWAPKR